MGVSVIDDASERSDTYGELYGYGATKSVVWGDDGTSLFARDWAYLSRLAVDDAGLRSPRPLYPTYFAADDLSRDMYFDSRTGYIFDSFKNVFDTRAEVALGPLPGGPMIALAGNCLPSGATATTDIATGKVFFVRITPGRVGLTISTYTGTGFAEIAETAVTYEQLGIPTRVGYTNEVPLRVTRLSDDGIVEVS